VYTVHQQGCKCQFELPDIFSVMGGIQRPGTGKNMKVIENSPLPAF